MEIEQVKQKLDWLDNERRQDKTEISSLENRIVTLEGDLPTITTQMKELSGEITRLNSLLGRMDQYDEALMQNRIETKRNLDELEKKVLQRVDEGEKIRQVEIRALDERLTSVSKDVGQINELQKMLGNHTEEDIRLGREILEVRKSIDTLRRSDEEYVRSFRLLEDGRRQDSKRLTDLQGEVTALRKNMDDQRGRSELTSAALQKVDTRLNELNALETERREEQSKFLENQAMIQVQRERTWKEWETRFDIIETHASDVETNLQTLDATHRAIKRTQQIVEELNQLVERRMSEMTEIQRLSEERFRQEWVTFKADDQKRWTNYTLTQDEHRGEAARQYDKLVDRVTHIEDNIQELQDIIQLMSEQTEKRLQALLAIVSEWVSTFERTMGRVR
jgi:chromosome segregation ATPase